MAELSPNHADVQLFIYDLIMYHIFCQMEYEFLNTDQDLHMLANGISTWKNV